MYRAFTVKNFRCFEYLSVEPLEQVNLIAGRNNVGKTALLEALFLSYGPNNPELSLRINVFRGVRHFVANPDDTWGRLFFAGDRTQPIEIQTLDESGRTAHLRIRLGEPTGPQETPAGGEPGEGPNGMALASTDRGSRSLVLEYEAAAGTTQVSHGSIVADGNRLVVRSDRADVVEVAPAVFIAARARFPAEDAGRFSRVRKSRQHDKLLDALKLLEGRLESVDLLLSGGQPLIHGDIGLGELLPLAYMGEGMGRLTSILLGIAAAEGGCLLVDEIENGFHHSVMTDVWRAIGRAAAEYRTQVFATTHSRECIFAAHEAFKSGPRYNLAVHRLELTKNRAKAISYGRDSLEAARKKNTEIR